MKDFNLNKMIRFSTYITVLCVIACSASAGTIYVDASAGGPGDGTAGDPYPTIGAAVIHLGVTNATIQGGHTIRIAAGTYNESVCFTSAVHAGQSGAPNTMLGVGDVLIDNSYPIRSTAEWMVFDGFRTQGNNSGAFYGVSDNCIIRNCILEYPLNNLDVRQSGIYINNAAKDLIVSNCVFHHLGSAFYINSGSVTVTVCNSTIMLNNGFGFMLQSGIDAGFELRVTNCIVAGNGAFAFTMRNALGKIMVRDSCVVGSAAANVYYEPDKLEYHTEEELNALSNANFDFSGVIVTSPGFSDLADNWNANEFYENSPCLKANSGLNSDMGAYHNPTTVPVSNKTYYVKNGGDDAANGLAVTSAWETISHAAALAGAGDTVRVQSGTYSESVLVTNSGAGDSPLTFVADGTATVDGGSYAFSLLGASGVILDGLDLTGATDGLNLNNSFDNTFRNCLFRSNTDGIQLYMSPGNLFEETTVCSNSAIGVNCAAWWPSGGVLSRCRIYGNDGGARFDRFSCGWRVENTCIYSNATYGVFCNYTMYSLYNVAIGGIPTRFYNCDIIGNVGHGVTNIFDEPQLDNCIIADNGVGICEAFANADVYAAYDCFWGNGTNFVDEGVTDCNTEGEINALAECSNNIVAAPGIKCFPDDVRLSPGSSCVDAGTPTAYVETDFFGKPRPVGTACDIGVYETPSKGIIFYGR